LKDIDEHVRLLRVREAVYDGIFSTPKTLAGSRQVPLSGGALQLVVEWKVAVKNTEPDALVFGTHLGAPISNNILRRSIFPACKRLGLLQTTWLTFRQTYSSWSHDKGVPGKVVAQLMGHANVDTTLSVYAGARRVGPRRRRTDRRRIVHDCSRNGKDRDGTSRYLIDTNGAPCKTRTCDLLVRSRLRRL